MPPSSNSPFRLLVEGKDDLHSVIQLMKAKSYDWDDAASIRPYVHDAKGIDEVLDQIPAAVKTYRRLGIVVDADDDLAARWASLQSRLSAAGFPLPAVPDENGTIVETLDERMIGIWLMPDNKGAGALEDFLRTLVPKDDAIFPHAEAATQRAIELGSSLRASDAKKGALHAWLAWQQTPGMPFGQAITAKALRPPSALSDRFADWFLRLFPREPVRA